MAITPRTLTAEAVPQPPTTQLVPIVQPATPVAGPPTRPFPYGSCSYNGITWGPGQWLQFVEDDGGLEETPDMTTIDNPRAEGHGTWSGQDWLGPKTWTPKFVVLGDSNEDLRAKLYQLDEAWFPDSVDRPLWVYDSNRYITARIRKRAFTHSQGGRGTVSWVTVQFFAADPLYYSPEQSVVLHPRQVTGGISFPLVFPLDFGTAQAGVVTVVSDSPVPTPVRIRVPGPCTNPQFSLDNVQGAVLDCGLTLVAGDVLDIDTGARTVVLNNGPHREAALGSAVRWSLWRLRKGPNMIHYRSDSGLPTESPVLSFSPAWM